MRSRYTAFTQINITYIEKTMQGKAKLGFDFDKTKAWASSLIWIGLEVIDVPEPQSTVGFVEFRARFIEDGRLFEMQERSEFLLENQHWFYVDGEQTPMKHKPLKIERNSPCPCHSGKKFKRCHGIQS